MRLDIAGYLIGLPFMLARSGGARPRGDTLLYFLHVDRKYEMYTGYLFNTEPRRKMSKATAGLSTIRRTGSHLWD